ncbi:hypothetical protein LCGC14_1560850 [marine sediment metagenome]|uniref:protein-glutamate O-methyltransferase n=1 Tax=marine sediment metagenome TaxID=412755 RepID=A0A0F9J8J6_9ZZZZ
MTVGMLQIEELAEAQFSEISVLVKELCGINLHQGKKELVKARLNKRLRTLGMPSYDAYIDFVRNDASGAELTMMLDALSTNLTGFFREPDHFDHLRDHVLTQWARGGDRTKPLRIWSAGCSSGEEPYTIAISVCEKLADRPFSDAKILATDLSTRVLAAGRKGVYPGERLQAVPPQLRAKHFTCVETRPDKLFRVNDTLRRLVHFAKLNLMDPWPMRGPFDAIFCRNVMIYFDKDTQGRLVQRFWQLLAPRGRMFIGHSESLAGVRHRFRYVQPTVYEKT